MEGKYIPYIIWFIISNVILSIGITSCVKLDYCSRSVQDNACPSATEQCQYNYSVDVVTGSCVNTTIDRECLYCQYCNNNLYRSF